MRWGREAFEGCALGHRDDLAKLTPALRRFAGALIPRDAARGGDPGGGSAHDLVVKTLTAALRTGRQASFEQLRMWLYSTLVHLNHARLQAESQAAGATPSSRSQGVSQSLMELSTPDREALLLVVTEGFTYAQSAEILGISRATLVSRVARARAVLEQHLDAALPFGARRLLRHPSHLRLVK
jgi:RNA polymerase sigma-70 factor (ECF subfamily)